ncbi:crossover junction endodeoxyribonuclease RuvC [Candidatus Protochlamydia phocaeensis]|uniref:crossover junction endodeoxyribonuclease RuvC n=1 Tax=Candidatus Protochlamydia phocaeensis TaxID=1414722 RepID=UPI000838507B|nr:crossover junction endodeoxyribonuclease RuvC [Candidatus Protochlamydia phocaeensis]
MKQEPPQSTSVILGIDPGTKISGYGLIRVQGHAFVPVDYGCIRPPSQAKLSERYLIIYDSIEQLIERYRPTALVVETQYVHKNVQSAIKLGMARGVAIVAAKKRGLPIFEYAPTQAKRAVVGTGKASKYQVQGMVQRLLNLADPPQPEDAADALALALCHAQSASFRLLDNEI